jgi:hypothetical protein
LKEEEKNKTKKDYPFFTKTIVPIFSYSPADSPLITKEKKKHTLYYARIPITHD